MITADKERLVDQREFARRVGLTYGTIRGYRHEKRIPPPDQIIGEKPLWKVETVDRWKADRDAIAAVEAD